jgi:putative membrane protein
MKKLIYLSMIASACFAFQACSSSNKGADSVDSAQDSNKNSTAIELKDDDSEFMVNAANGGMMEVAAGKLAQTKGKSQAVKDFGAKMVADHTAAGDELKALAAVKNVTLPSSPGEDEQKHLNDMEQMSGKDFDKHYIDMMVKDHDKTIEMFEDAAKNGKDAAVRDWATKTLPTLKKHGEMVKAIKDKM